MSYCVNCGVKLDQELNNCPLCNTIVINPAIIDLKTVLGATSPESIPPDISTTFPQKSGQVEDVVRRDLGLLITIILGGIAISALLLNIFVFRDGWWSLLIIGFCVILFFLALPAFILTKTPIYVSIVFDALGVALYLYFISLITTDSAWLYGIAFPVLTLLTFILLILVFLIRSFKSTLLKIALYIITAIAVLCIGLEIIIDIYNGSEVSLMWSAIIFTVCAVIDAGLITVLSRRRLRVAVQKRLHF